MTKLVIANTAATADGGDTVDFDTYLKTIKGVLLVNNDGSTAIGSGTWSGTVVTIPSTMSDNQTVNMLVWGTD